MTYLICDEQLLDLEGYLDKLRAYMEWYKKTYDVKADPRNRPAPRGRFPR
jgi:hypothetical protein